MPQARPSLWFVCAVCSSLETICIDQLLVLHLFGWQCFARECRILQMQWNLSKFPHVPSLNIANPRSSWFLGINLIQSFFERDLFLDASSWKLTTFQIKTLILQFHTSTKTDAMAFTSFWHIGILVQDSFKVMATPDALVHSMTSRSCFFHNITQWWPPQLKLMSSTHGNLMIFILCQLVLVRSGCARTQTQTQL